nr:hypothetical protein [Tanacetum cinerariifolium]
SRLDDGRICREMVDEFDPLKFFVSVRGMEHDQLFTEFNAGAARQMSLSIRVREREIENVKAQLFFREAEATKAIRLCAEASNFEAIEISLRDKMNALKERNVVLEKEQNALDVKVTDLEALAVSKEHELTDLNSLVTSVKSQNDNLANRVNELEISSFRLQEKITVYENCIDQLEKIQDDRMKVVNDKFDKLYTNFVEMALHLDEKFYSHLLTTIFDRMWLLTHDMKLAIVNCLNLIEYLSALGAAIGKAIEKGMQDGLSAGITNGKEGRVLIDVAAYNPSMKVDYISALQQLQNVNFSLLARFKSNKDASVETVTNILRLEGPHAEKLGLNELQPNDDRLMVLIHHSPDHVVGATSLSLALDVSSTEGTFNTAAATTDTTTSLSTTFASASTIAPIFVDDYEVIGADDQAVADGDVVSFPNVANIPSPRELLSSRSLNLYAPFSSASVTSYGPSHLGPIFSVFSARLTLLLQYTSVGMPIFAGMTAYVPYVNENGVSPLLDFIIVRSRLDDGRFCREMVDEFDPLKFFMSVHGMEHDQLFTEFNVGATRQMSLSVGVREREIENVKAQLFFREAEATKAIRLCAEASNFEAIEISLWDKMNALKERNVVLEKEQNALDVKVTDLEALAVSKERELTDLNSLVTSVKSQNDNLADRVNELEISYFGLQEKITVYENCIDQLEKFQDDRMKLLTHDMELAIVNCLNLIEYLSALGAAIGKAIEKGMQYGLSAGITNGKEGRVLTDVAAYNPSMKVDYISALQQLQDVNFSLLARLKSNKDASVETVTNILLLEGPHAEKLGLNELQPNDDQLMVLIHHSPDHVAGATSLSLALDVSSTEGTFNTTASTTDTTTSLSTTFASASTIAPISVDDYEVIGADDQAVADGDAASFPNVLPKKVQLCQFPICKTDMETQWDLVFAVDSLEQIICLRACCKTLHISLSAHSFLEAGLRTAAMGFLRIVFKNRSHPRISFFFYYCQYFHFTYDFSFSSFTNTCLLKCAKLVDAILFRALAFLISLLGTCLIKNALKLLVCEYQSCPGTICADDPSVNKIHGSGSSSSTSIGVSRESSSGHSTMKFANNCPLTDTLGHPHTLRDFCQFVCGTLCPPGVAKLLWHFSDQKASLYSRIFLLLALLSSVWPENIPPAHSSDVPQYVLGRRSYPQASRRFLSGLKTVTHLSGINLLLFRVITPPSTGSFSILGAVDKTACNFLTLGFPIIPLYGNGDLTTTKFIQTKWSVIRLQSLLQLVVVLVTIFLEGYVRRRPTSVLWSWLFSSSYCISHGGRRLARSELFMIAHGEYFRRTQLYSGPMDNANLLVQKWFRVRKMDLGLLLG